VCTVQPTFADLIISLKVIRRIIFMCS
jgi:hypothetical protein